MTKNMLFGQVIQLHQNFKVLLKVLEVKKYSSRMDPLVITLCYIRWKKLPPPCCRRHTSSRTPSSSCLSSPPPPPLSFSSSPSCGRSIVSFSSSFFSSTSSVLLFASFLFSYSLLVFRCNSLILVSQLSCFSASFLLTFSCRLLYLFCQVLLMKLLSAFFYHSWT